MPLKAPTYHHSFVNCLQGCLSFYFCDLKLLEAFKVFVNSVGPIVYLLKITNLKPNFCAFKVFRFQNLNIYLNLKNLFSIPGGW